MTNLWCLHARYMLCLMFESCHPSIHVASVLCTMSEVYHRFIHWSATFTDVVIQYMYCHTGFKDLELIVLSILVPIFLLPHHNFCIGSSFNAKDNRVQTFPRWHTMLWVTYQLELLNPLLTDHSVVRVTRLEEWVHKIYAWGQAVGLRNHSCMFPPLHVSCVGILLDLC